MTKAKYTPEERKKVKAKLLKKNVAKAKKAGYSTKNKDRELAIKEGRKFYVGKRACKKCGCIIKYVSSCSCHYCALTEGLKKLRSGATKKYHTKEKTKVKVDRWRKNNPDKFRDQWRRTDKAKNAEKSMRYACKKRNQSPDLTGEQKNDILELYATARRLTEETGVKHEVDHIYPISKGGLHHPDNLQILTKYENQSKGNRI